MSSTETTETTETVTVAEPLWPIDFRIHVLDNILGVYPPDTDVPFMAVRGRVNLLDIYTLIDQIACLPGVSVETKKLVKETYWAVKQDLTAPPEF
jgi:hypothetical protein